MTAKSKYSLVVETAYSVTINYDFLDVPGADYDYREKFAKKVSHACWEANQRFGTANDHKGFYPMDNFHHQLVRISGKDQEQVLLAGQAVAKTIFSHKYVVPRP